MSDNMLNQLQEYGSLLEDVQNPLTVSDVISRARHIQTLPDDQPATGAGTTKRSTRALVFAAGLVLLVVVSILLASLQTEVPPAGSTIPGPELPTTVPGPNLPTTVPTSAWGSMWPQANLEEVHEAQELADAGDPNYTWQLDPNMASILTGGQVDTPEILARFLREEFGWEEFAMVAIPGNTVESGGIRADGVQLIRCEPGKANPIWPDDPRFGGCSPTIDDFHYERVEIYVAQPGKRGPEGIWVASMWGEVDPFEQVAPLTDAEIAAIVEPFLQARIAGEGAEEYLQDLSAGDWLSSGYVAPGFLYATSTGAPYERAEFEVVDGGEWPGGSMKVKVRLFAEGGQTVVEQTFSSGRGGALYHHQDDLSTENGQPLPKT